MYIIGNHDERYWNQVSQKWYRNFRDATSYLNLVIAQETLARLDDGFIMKITVERV